MNVIAWFIFVAAAILEVAGDATVRRGLRGGGVGFIVARCLSLGGYGLIVNSLKWDLSRLLGAYVGFFALVSVLFGRIILRETVPPPPGGVWP